MKALKKQQLELLKVTPDNRLKSVFPDFTRAFLREEKRKMVEKKTIEEEIEIDKEKLTQDEKEKTTTKRYKKSLSIINQLQSELEASLEIRKHLETYQITANKQTDLSEATAVMVASDWHCEEEVKPNTINGLNKYNLQIAEARITKFFQNSLKLLKIFSRDVEINNIVLALLGDFISGNIHEENLETGQLPPIEAIIWCQKRIMGGIQMLLKETKCNIIIPCCSGNHSRITDKIRSATEVGNSLETFMYHSMAMFFENEPRVSFVIGEGYHTYLSVYDKVIRFHHGHSIKYSGGVGGIYIPVNKAISQWNKAKHADIDVIAHWHQQRDGGNFIVNGSIIGYNAYALRIKADYEQPRQTFFLIDKKRGKTIVAPILVDKD